MLSGILQNYQRFFSPRTSYCCGAYSGTGFLFYPHLRKTGISNNMKIKRTDPELKWFGVIVYGNGESYYYEGIGDPGALGTREVVEYEWSELE